MDLQGFDINLCSSYAVPGIATLEYTGIDDVDTSSYETQAVDTGYIQRRNVLAEWHQLPFVVGTGAFQEDQVADAQGDHYRLNLSVLLPADNAAVRAELQRMKQRRFLVRQKGRDGRTMVIGTVERPLRFESRFDSGPQGGDQRAHRCTFTGVSISKIPDYDPEW